MLTIPTTMKACQGKDYGAIDEMISVVTDGGVRVPSLSDLPLKQRKNMMLIKVLAVALAPGDARVLSGKTRELQGPPSFPYIPGGDCCGIVMELPEEKQNNLPFQVGDRVAARFVGKPLGALGEYALVSTLVAEKVPPNISCTGAAALASASPAVVLSELIRPEKDHRILVLGAGGGMGSHFCQLIRNKRSEKDDNKLFVVGVSQSPQRLLESPLNYDRAIDYTKDNIFQMNEFQKEPFDVIVDFGSGGWLALTEAAGSPSIVKSANLGGRFLTTTVDTPTFEIHSIWQMLNIFLFPPLWRAFITRYTWSRKRLPKYTFAMCLPEDRTVMTKTMQYAAEQSLVPVIHANKPFPFTTQGVRDAFRTVASHHPHGKVVIHVADE